MAERIVERGEFPQSEREGKPPSLSKLDQGKVRPPALELVRVLSLFNKTYPNEFIL